MLVLRMISDRSNSPDVRKPVKCVIFSKNNLETGPVSARGPSSGAGGSGQDMLLGDQSPRTENRESSTTKDKKPDLKVEVTLTDG